MLIRTNAHHVQVLLREIVGHWDINLEPLMASTTESSPGSEANTEGSGGEALPSPRNGTEHLHSLGLDFHLRWPTNLPQIFPRHHELNVWQFSDPFHSFSKFFSVKSLSSVFLCIFFILSLLNSIFFSEIVHHLKRIFFPWYDTPPFDAINKNK